MPPPIVFLARALCEELGLNDNEGAALPLKNTRPSFPWKTIEEFDARWRDLAAYEIRKDKATYVSHTCWPRELLDFNQQELAFLEGWLQERVHKEPGSAHGEQTSHGVWNAQLMNLVWASNMEIEPRELKTASWPWRTTEEFYQRLRSAVTMLYRRAWFRLRPTSPFHPEEDRFMVAWIQETNEMSLGEEVRPALALYKAHVPATGDDNWLGVDRSEWARLGGVELAWLRTKGLHRLAVAGGPPPEGEIVYPWKDRAEFETRVRDADMINHASQGVGQWSSW